METDNSFHLTLLQELITKKYLKLDKKKTSKDYLKITDVINTTDFTSFINIPQNISLSARSVRKFFNNKPLGSFSLSILVVLAYLNNEKFLLFFKAKYNNDLNLAWDAYLTYTKFKIESKEITENKKIKNLEVKKFTDPLLFLYTSVNKNPIYLFLFFLIVYPLIINIWAVMSDVWIGIDYPLSKSMSVYIGYFFYAISAAQLTLFNAEYKKLLQINPPLKHSVINNNFKFFFLILATIISIMLHYSFLKDNIHGWCENKIGVISYLGVYHTFLYAFNLWIIFNFQYYFTRFNKLIKTLDKIDDLSKNEIEPYINTILTALSKLNIIYKNIIISYGGFSILFFVSLIIFEIEQSIFHLENWQWMEIGIIMVFYILFGFILYWNFFNKAINRFLKTTKQKLLVRDFENIHLNNYILSLPQTVNHIDEYKSGLRNVLIWIITIVIAICFGLMFYLQMI